MTSSRHYKVAGLTFGVRLEAPWHFMDYTEAVAERISSLAAGRTAPVQPTRAGDKVPRRTLVTLREELPQSWNPQMLDFSQYEPFHTECEDDLFTLKVCESEPEELVRARENGETKLLLNVDKEMPCYYIYSYKDGILIEFDADRGHIAASLFIPSDISSAELYPKPGVRSYALMNHITTALMVLFSYNSAAHDVLLMHSSCVLHKGRANMFLGTSGTGKSTHSRLWLNNIEGCELVNDDNPALRLEDGELFIYGTPWSGKTPCYRNVKLPVRAIVSLKQAPANSIRREEGMMAFISVIGSASRILWDRQVMDAIASTANRIAMSTPYFTLDCLPDADAALTCQAAIEAGE